MSDSALGQVKRCPTNVLPDTPTTDDSFGHEAVSRAIADLISTSDGGKAIALTGSWGSGKSSVLEILATELHSKEDTPTETFVFDAWAHQGDPLRRSFLEQLVSQLTITGWLPRREYWKDRISELARRLQRITTTSTPVLTIWGGLFAVLLLLAPVGLQLFSKYDNEKFNHPTWALVGFSLALLPFVFGVLAFLWLRPNWKFWEEQFWRTNRAPYEKRSVLGLLLNKTQEKNEINAIHTPDPTSVEFQQFFREILEEALIEKRRRLIVAVDNLDRVDAEDARAIWATLKAFFDFSAQVDADWLSRVWLIVPFDPSALNRLWKNNDPRITGPESAPASNELADSFTDKTFQITFRVSPPVLSDWQAFFEKQLRLAFPMNHEDHFHTVYRVYDLKRLAASRPPTPRDIKIFINRVGAIHRQWQDEIPLHLQALYVLLAREFPQLELELTKRDEEILRTVPIQLVGSEWRKAIAAIHFNVSQDKALQIAIGEPIRAALVEGNAEELKKLQQVEGFEPVLERVVEANYHSWSSGESKSLSFAALALAGLRMDENPSYAQTWTWLQYGAQRVESWSGLDAKVASGLVQIFQYRPAPDLAAKIVKAISNSLPDAEKEEILPASVIERWLAGVGVVMEHLGGQFNSVAVEQFYIPGTVGNYTQVLSVASSKPELKPLLHFFRPAVTCEDVIDKLKGDCAAGNFDNSRTQTVGAMLMMKEGWPWSVLVTAFEGRLRTPNQLQASEVRSILRASLDIARTQNAANEMLSRIAKEGFLANHMWHSRQAAQKDAVALCLLPWIETVHTLSLPSLPGAANNGLSVFRQLIQNPGSDPENLQLCADFFVQYGRTEHLFDIYSKFAEARTFIAATIQLITQKDNVQDVISPRCIVDSYQLLREALPETSLKLLVEKSTAASELRIEVASHPFTEELAALYVQILQCPGDNETFRKFLLDGLRALQKAKWLTELQAEGPLMEITLTLASHASGAGGDLGLSTAFQDALYEHAEKLLSGAASVSKLRDKWAVILLCLTGSSREAFQFRLSDLLCEAERPTDAVLSLYGKQLASSPALIRSRERLVLLGFSKMIGRKGRAELDWISEALNSSPEIWNVSAAAHSDFEERIKKLREDTTEDSLRPTIQRIAASVGIKT